MTDFILLKKAMEDSGITTVAICKKAGISRATLYNRFKGVGEFNAREIKALCEILRISTEERELIFFS